MTDEASGKRQFSTVVQILPPQPKALDEARGYVIADYQDALEKAWVEDLRQQYPVKTDEAVLSSLIRK
jgi:peptidyl-prolyl cis-trans isomerase SurA